MTDFLHAHSSSPRRHTALAVGASLVAVGAYGGAIGLATGWLSLTDRLNHRLPFHSPVFGGVALLVLIAVPFSMLAGRAWRAEATTGATSIVVGAMTVAWIAVQMAFLRQLSFFHPLFAAIGVVYVVAGVRVRARLVPEVDRGSVERFLAQRRIVLIGATDDPHKFGCTIRQALVDHGYDVVNVNPNRTMVAGARCLPDLQFVPGEIEAAMVMLTGPEALAAVRDCAARGVRRVWLFRGVGAPGALSPAALRVCREHGIDVVAGACPLMFLPPVASAHQAHLALRRFAGAVS